MKEVERLTWMEAGSALTERALVSPRLGPGFPLDQVAVADRMEIWGTTLAADVEYTEFRLYQGGRLMGVRRIAGY